MVQEFVSGVIVACGVGDERVDSQVVVHITKLRDRNDGRNAVMSFGFEEAQIERQIKFKVFIVARDEISRVTIEITRIMAVPAPSSVWV